jgi:hypothetical protein
MPFIRCLVALASVLLSVSAFMLQAGPRDATLDVCPWLQQLGGTCPPWLSARSIPESAPLVLYALASLGLLFVIMPLFRRFLDQPPETTLEAFIQRGRDLHERCRKEGDQAVLADIGTWTEEVSRFLRRLGHRYVVAFGDFAGIHLFASQYDTAASMEIRQRLQRLSEFLQKFREDGGQAG